MTGGSGVLADRADFETPDGAFQEEIDTERRNEGNDKTPVNTHPVHQLGQGRFIEYGFRLWPAHAHGVLHRAFQHHLHEEQDDEVQQQGGDDFIDAKPGFKRVGPSMTSPPASAPATITMGMRR